MAKVNHTRGPWSFVEKLGRVEAGEIPARAGRIKRGEHSEVIAFIAGSPGARAIPNALLIAAAPELLEAVKDLLRAFDELMPGLAHISVKDYANVNSAPIRARHAIEKAEGL
jgi:hypothetical protein